ncbi:MAG: hypothetical protein BroJett030_16360 [Alphaproteobacteria bacterium]|nr:MAG: hypothetical protein BroJett030_16360 [Alphaproteobacteria bacterium]
MEIMIASATQATTTIAAPADRPPMKANIEMSSLPPEVGKDRTNRSALALLPKGPVEEVTLR